MGGLADSASTEKVKDQNEPRNSYNYYMMTPKRLRRKRFSETRTERQVGNVRLDGVYLSSPCLSKCYHSNGGEGGAFSLGLMRNGTDSLDSALLGRLMKGRASGKGRRCTPGV